MGKVFTPTTIVDVQAALADLNQNFANIEAALDRAYDRLLAAEVSNKMQATLDLNNQSVINGNIVLADTVQASTLNAQQTTFGKISALSTSIRFRKEGRYVTGDINTAPIFLGLPGSVDVTGDASIVQGQGIVVPEGVGGLGLAITASVYQNQALSTSIGAVFAAGFSRIIPTVQLGLGPTFDDYLTIEPVLGSPSFASTSSSTSTRIPAAATGHVNPHYFYSRSAASFYCPVQPGDILYPHAWAQNVIRSAAPDATHDYEFEVVIEVLQNRVTPIAMSAEVDPIFPFAGITNPNV